MSNHKHIWHDAVDDDNAFTKLMTEILPKSISSDIHASAIGKVTEYKKSKHTCSVQILPLQLDNDKVAVINEVIVPESIWRADEILERQDAMNKLQNDYNKTVKSALAAAKVPVTYTDIWKPTDKQKIYKKFFKVGTVVSVGFFDRELDNYQNNASNYKTETDRMHSLNDPFVIGVVKS